MLWLVGFDVSLEIGWWYAFVSCNLNCGLNLPAWALKFPCLNARLIFPPERKQVQFVRIKLVLAVFDRRFHVVKIGDISAFILAWELG